MRLLRVHHLSGPKCAHGKNPSRAAAMMVSGEMSRQTPAKVSGLACVALCAGTRVPPRAMSISVRARRYGSSCTRLGWQAYAVPISHRSRVSAGDSRKNAARGSSSAAPCAIFGCFSDISTPANAVTPNFASAPL